MEPHKIVSRQEWTEARKAFLDKEKEFTRARDRLSAERRALPWVKVDKAYVFDTPERKKTLAELFDGRSQLIVYHFMLGPDWEEGCPSCSFLADHFDGANIHLAQRDVTFVAISRAPLAEIEAFKRRMGWHFPWVSSFANDFNFDFHVSFKEDEVGKDGDYNYERQEIMSDEMPGASVFYKDETGGVFHTYSAYARGLDILVGAYNFLDLTPKGRDEAELPWTMAWVRHHDRYESAKPSHSCCAGAAE
ncbi:MAG TPA: thioredoxin family protein [Methyloceanibacter sp.]